MKIRNEHISAHMPSFVYHFLNEKKNVQILHKNLYKKFIKNCINLRKKTMGSRDISKHLNLNLKIML